MLTSNVIYGVQTVLLGLMNGARGKVVGIRHSANSSPPSLPDYVAVEFPGYSGDPIFPGEGREKWAPVPFAERKGRKNPNLARTGLPLILCWAISIVKSQGLTLNEVLVNLSTKSGMSPLRLPGLAYVAFTRVTSLAGFACRDLPPIEAFLQCRKHEHHLMRERYEVKMDELHEKFTMAIGITPDGEVDLHMGHLEKQSLLKKGRPPTDEEREERNQMLRRRGILPLPEDVREANVVTKRGGNQSDILRPFRGGARLQFGASISDVAPKLKKKRLSAMKRAAGAVFDVGSEVYGALHTGRAVAIGVPLARGRVGFARGDIVTVRENPSGISERYVVGESAVGPRGFRSMFKSHVVESWADLAPFEESENGALEFYMRTYTESSTKERSGRWAIAALQKHLPTRDAGPGPDHPSLGGGGKPDPLLAGGSDEIRPISDRGINGFTNEATDPIGSGRRSYVRCFIIATAQALFACPPVEAFLADHVKAHRSPSDVYQIGASSAYCYICALADACQLARNGSSAPIGSGEHSLWSGPPWEFAAQSFTSLAKRFPFDQQCASDEYLYAILNQIEEAAMWSVDAPNPFATQINISQMPPCHECGSPCPDISRESSIAHIELPNVSHRRLSTQTLVEGYLKWPIHYAQVCGAGDPKCDAMIQIPRNKPHDCHAVNPVGRAALILFLDRADPDIGKNCTKIAAPETLRFAGADWEFCSATRHIGSSLESGHYISIVQAKCGGFCVADDSIIEHPTTLPRAWESIEAEPIAMVFRASRKLPTPGPLPSADDPPTGSDSRVYENLPESNNPIAQIN